MTATGDFALAMPPHGVSIAFAPHDRTVWSVDGGTSTTSPVIAGSVLIHPERDFVWHYRENLIRAILEHKFARTEYLLGDRFL